jgi:hypothetical protein
MALATAEAQSLSVLLFPMGQLKQLFFCHYVIGEFIGVIGGDGEMLGK